MRKARPGGATPEKGVASGKLLFQRRFGAKANHSSLAICKAPKVLLSWSTATTTTAMSTTRALQRRRLLAGGLRGAACTSTDTLDAPTIQFTERGGEREREREDEELRSAPSSCSPHSALPDAGTEPAAGSSHQPRPATLCQIKGLPGLSSHMLVCILLAVPSIRNNYLLHTNVVNRVLSCVLWRG